MTRTERHEVGTRGGARVWLTYGVNTDGATELAKRLDIGLHSRGVCPACLGEVAIALDHGDARKVAGAITSFAPFLWGEGLGDSVRGALEAATGTGDREAAAALRELRAKGPRSRVFRAVVRRLAIELRAAVRRADMAARN